VKTEDLRKDLETFAKAVSKGTHSPEEEAAAVRAAIELATRFHATCLAIEQIAAHLQEQKSLLK
jgi:hypothetical protein